MEICPAVRGDRRQAATAIFIHGRHRSLIVGASNDPDVIHLCPCLRETGVIRDETPTTPFVLTEMARLELGACLESDAGLCKPTTTTHRHFP